MTSETSDLAHMCMLLMANIAMAPRAHVHGGYYRAVDLHDVCLFDLPPIPAASATTSPQWHISRAHARGFDWQHVCGQRVVVTSCPLPSFSVFLSMP